MVPHALELRHAGRDAEATRGIVVGRAMRRWLHEIGGVWKRATLVAKDDDPHRVERFARLRSLFAPLQRCEAMGFADARDIHPWPTVGCAWMPQRTQLPIMTPGQRRSIPRWGPGGPRARYTTGLGPRKTNALFRALLAGLTDAIRLNGIDATSVVVDHSNSHQATAVEPWLATHPRVTRLLLPTYGPRANPIERVFGDVHDLLHAHHRRTR